MLLFNRAAMHLIQVNNLEKYDTAYAGDPFAFLFSSMQFTFKKEFLMSIIKLKFILYIDRFTTNGRLLLFSGTLLMSHHHLTFIPMISFRHTI